jgi:uncharacterized protein (TIGR03067 family)
MEQADLTMKIACRLGCLVLLLLVACKAGSGSADDVKQWQGTWRMAACTYDGQPQTADMEWVVNGDHYNIRLNQQTHPDPYMFKLDPIQSHIDVFHHETPPGTYGGSLKGIYEIRGDTLTVCYDLTGQQYPTSFDASPGSRRVLYKFQRE